MKRNSRAYISCKKGHIVNQKLYNRIKFANEYILQLESRILELENAPTFRPLEEFHVIEELKKIYTQKYTLLPITMAVQNPEDENRTIKKEIRPENIICIKSLSNIGVRLGNQGRRKTIYYLDDIKNKKYLKKFELNNDENFRELCLKIDRYSNFLCVASKNTVINVMYYNIDEEDTVLKLNINTVIETDEILSVPISRQVKFRDYPAIDYYKMIKSCHDESVLFQKWYASLHSSALSKNGE